MANSTGKFFLHGGSPKVAQLDIKLVQKSRAPTFNSLPHISVPFQHLGQLHGTLKFLGCQKKKTNDVKVKPRRGLASYVPPSCIRGCYSSEQPIYLARMQLHLLKKNSLKAILCFLVSRSKIKYCYVHK